MTGLRAAFEEAAAGLGSELDPEQRPAVQALTAAGERLLRGRSRTAPGGVYLHGPVGRGKTWLVEVLTAALPEGAVVRLHAYEAARLLHRGTAARSGTRSGLDGAVADVVGGARALFLDELHAHDPGDAMLLSRLVRALPARGVALLATSNYPPTGLLPDPRHHHLVLPLVTALEQTCEVVEVTGAVDHRTLGRGGARPRWSSGAWLCPGGPAQLSAVGLVPPGPARRRQLRVGGRPLVVLAADEPDDDGALASRVDLHFTELCQRPTSVGDVLELTDRFGTLVLSGVPAVAAADEDAWRRFANLVDVCWDRDVRLVVLAAEPPEAVLAAPVTDAHRTHSRLSLLRRP